MRNHARKRFQWRSIFGLLAAVMCTLALPCQAREDEDEDRKPPEAAPFESAEASVVVISSAGSKPPVNLMGEPRALGFLGYGFLITADGLVATCDRVLPKRLADGKVYLTDVQGDTYWGEVLKRDPFSGFAILRMQLPDLRLRVSLLKLSPLQSEGDEVVLLRSPATTPSPDVEARLGRLDEEGEGVSVFTLDTKLESRAEGFPVVDRNGLFVGMAGLKIGFSTAISLYSSEVAHGDTTWAEDSGSPYRALENELVVVPGRRLLKFVNEWLEEEKNRILRLPAQFAVETDDPGISSLLVPRIPSGQELEKTFGLSIADLTEELVKEYGLAPGARGIVITDVEEEGPAARAGLARGLVIYQIGRYEVTSLDDVSELARELRANTLTEFVVGNESVPANNVSRISMSRKYLNAR